MPLYTEFSKQLQAQALMQVTCAFTVILQVLNQNNNLHKQICFHFLFSFSFSPVGIQNKFFKQKIGHFQHCLLQMLTFFISNINTIFDLQELFNKIKF